MVYFILLARQQEKGKDSLQEHATAFHLNVVIVVVVAHYAAGVVDCESMSKQTH